MPQIMCRNPSRFFLAFCLARQHDFASVHLMLFLGPVIGRTIFRLSFEQPDLFTEFAAGFFVLIFVGTCAQKNHPRKALAKSSSFDSTINEKQNFRHISAEWPGQLF